MLVNLLSVSRASARTHAEERPYSNMDMQMRAASWTRRSSGARRIYCEHAMQKDRQMILLTRKRDSPDSDTRKVELFQCVGSAPIASAKTMDPPPRQGLPWPRGARVCKVLTLTEAPYVLRRVTIKASEYTSKDEALLISKTLRIGLSSREASS